MPHRLLQIILNFLIISCTLVFTVEASAVPAMGMGYAPKYPPEFKNFDYVNPQAKHGGELVLSGLGAFDSLNPFLLKGIPADGLNLLVFETLLEKSLDEPFSMYGMIADDFFLAEDGLSVTFHINPKARFSNGTSINAEDVKFSFDVLMSQAAHPQFRIYYQDVDSVIVLDDLTVRFNFKRQNRELHMILGDISVFSKDWLQGQEFSETDDIKPISSGPYVVDKYERGKYIKYKRNPDYWAVDLPVRKGMYNFDTIKYTYYKDSSIALEAFKAGEFDFFFENYSKRWARSHDGPKYQSGEILKTELKHSNNAGMQGFAINTRRDHFKDVRVRRALSLAYDFSWANNHLFYNQYVRCDSYFSNSELAATGLPEDDELALLNEFRDQLPETVFTRAWSPPATDKKGALRENLKQARDLLEKAGWFVKDGVLKNSEGESFTVDVLLAQKGFDRILAPYARNLKKLGIEMNYRTVDRSLYKRRVDTYDFDMVVTSYSSSMSPGNELKNRFHSQSVSTKGSDNLPGINNPVVDALIERVVNAENRQQLLIASRALDRVLLSGEYLVPNWYIDKHRIAYRKAFDYPKKLPLYYDPITLLIKTWWKKTTISQTSPLQ
ncbi:MAG: extracellular solute-binding protein [Gammaproteobacteria bacterium]|nr:extracellular solute-binding protein [Gammaproteobacteria bacterium]